MFNEARGVSNFICDSPGLPLTLQKQLCHSLIQSDLFPSLNSSRPSYWSLLQPLLTSFPPFCSFLHFHMHILFPSNFLLIDHQSFYSPTHLLSLRKCIFMMSFFCLHTDHPSLHTLYLDFSDSLTLSSSSTFLSSQQVQVSFRLTPFALHQPNNHVFFNLFFEQEIKTESDQCWRDFKRFDFKGTWRGQGNARMVILC